MKKSIQVFSLILILSFSSCTDEPIGEATILGNDLIEVDSELYRMLESIAEDEPLNVTACLDFIYSFTINIYDTNLELIGFEVIHNDREFVEFLGSVSDGNSIGLSYPITSILANGEQLVINNNEELQENLGFCLEEEVLGYCNGLLEDCVWKVAFSDGENNDFEGAYFEISPLGNVWFHYNEEIIFGIWITFIINDELHLNINLNNQDIAGERWNFDWKVTILNEFQIKLINNEVTFLIEKECFSPCKQLVFEECELEPYGGIARFNLSSYINCFLSFTEIDDLTNISITFHETKEAAEKSIDPLNDTNFLNNTNPQVIYVRFEDNDTEVLVSILPIYIVAVFCL